MPVYDNRHSGESDGEPRSEIDPWQQIRDYRDAITHAASWDRVDSDRIGIWGSCYSGGHVLAVAALDRRVKCVVSQVLLGQRPHPAVGGNVHRVRARLLHRPDQPHPLMMVVARGDHLTPQDLTLRAYQAALEPKRLLVLPGGHFDAYVGDAFAMSAPAQRDWFAQHLR